jgi:K+-transporting ATPase ATPase C chain
MGLLKELRLSLFLLLTMVLLTGVAYPLIVTGIAQLFFPATATGSFIEKDGKVVGSELIGQNFIRPEYFHPRPSAVGFDARSSGGSNAAPSSAALIADIKARTEVERGEVGQRQIPIDLVTASGSGLDPHISPQSAYSQAPRVATTRNMAEGDLWALIATHVEDRTFGILGEPRINVLKLNLALDALAAETEPAAAPAPAASAN